MMRGRTLRIHERVVFLGGFAFAVFGVLIYAAPAHVAGIDLPMPWLALLPVFFWGVLSSDLLRGVTAFALGLFQDLISGGPLGVWASAYLIAFVAATYQREALSGQSAGAIWIGYVVIVFVAAVSAYAAGALAAQFRPAPELEGLGFTASALAQGDIRPGPAVRPLIFEALATALIAPLAARALGGFGRIGEIGRAL